MCIITLILKRSLKMTVLHPKGVVMKVWYFLRTYVLTLRRFDLFLQGSLLIIILLETNVFLLLRRDYGGGPTPAYIEDWILMSAAGAEFLVGTLVGWWGGRKRNFALSGWLAAAAVCGALVLFVPFMKETSPFVELCGGGPIMSYGGVSSDPDPGQSARLGFLIIAALVCSLTKVSIWALGFTYVDDHEPHNGPYVYGILISIRLSLGLSGQNWLQPASLRDDWWKGHLSICCLTLMFAILFTLFPTKMKEFGDDDGTLNRKYFPSLARVVRNKVLVLQTIALAFLTTAVFGFVHYDRSFVQARFNIESYRQDPRSSRSVSEVFRALVIIFFVMIFRVRFSDRRADGVKANTASKVGGVVAVIVAVLMAAITALGCDVGTIEGAGEKYEQPVCSAQCGCDSARYGYSPVCGLQTDTTYFSPCHAGCRDVRYLNGFPLFLNCTCGAQAAARAACSIDDCRGVFSAYLVLYTVFLAVSGASFLMQGMVVVRAVRRLDKPIAMAASFAAIALLSSVLGHLIYMGISYATCSFQSDGRCVLHKQSLWIVACTSSILALCSAAVSILASRVRSVTDIPTTEL